MNKEVREMYFDDLTYRCLWEPLKQATGSRWNIKGYPILSRAKRALDFGMADEEICIIASEELE